MKKLLLLALLFGVCISSHATTWYIRHDGGTNIQCSGTTNAPYPGSGTGKACAYDHPYQLLNYWGVWNKIGANDTIQFSDPPTNTVPYYMGEQNGGLGMDWSATVGGICGVPNSGYPAGASCILPPLPNGVAIIGQNAGSCHTLGHTGLVNPTILSGISGAYNVIDLQGTDQITLNCLEITQPDNCTMSGGGSGGGCAHSANYISEAGIRFEDGTNQGPRRLTMTDVMVAGTAGDGIHGSKMNALSSDVSTATDIYIWGNGDAGVNSDGGGCGNGCESIGTWNINYIDVEANGCLLLKPFDNTPGPTAGANAFNYCFGQSSGGYGDGFVLIAAGNFTVNISNGIFKYNTQDGFDALHISDDVTTSPITNISTSWSEGNGGQTFKLGVGASATAINNVAIANCRVLNQSASFPNNPSGWIALDFADTCRAEGDQWSFQLKNGSVLTLENNTSTGYGTTMYDLGCASLAPNCGSNGGVVKFINNISLGFPDANNAGRLASGWYLEPGILISTVAADHNLWWNMHTGCPDNGLANETNYVCADPLLISESDFDTINPNLSSNSPAIGAGIPISAVTIDYNGLTRPVPPSIGALEPAANAPAAPNSPAQTQSPSPPAQDPPVQTQSPSPPAQTPPAQTQSPSPPAQTPPVVTPPTMTWLEIASEGDTVTIPGGYTVRFGAPQGTPPGNNLVSAPLAADSYDPPVTFSTTTTFVVSNAYFGSDPAPNYVKQLDITLNSGSN
jgi:hypothetical protein